MCKPLLPLVQDEIAHIFWKADHLASIHHHHGDNHAEEEIADAAHKEDNGKHSATAKTSEPVFIHIFSQLFYNIPQQLIEKEKYIIKSCNFISISVDKHYPPPKSC